MRWLFFSLFTCFAYLSSAFADAPPLPLIRDEEIEDYVSTLLTPLCQAADIPLSLLHIHLIQGPELNAFVTPDYHLFLYTGLFTKTPESGMVLGILAHEMGHILQGHFLQRKLSASSLAQGYWVSAALGMAAMVAGATEAGGAVIMGGIDATNRFLLGFNRTQERSADSTSLDLLWKAQYSAAPLVRLFETLSFQDKLHTQDLYNRTHPLSEQRLRSIRNHKATHLPDTYPPSWQMQHAHIQAKINAYQFPPERVLKEYTTHTPPSLYAQAIAYLRLGQYGQALERIHTLEKVNPSYPYYTVLKGELYFIQGNIHKAIQAWEALFSHAPSSLVALQLGISYLSLTPPHASKALSYLRYTLEKEPDNILAWEYQAKAHHHLGNLGLRSFSMASKYFYSGSYPEAKKWGEEAVHILQPGPVLMQAKDLLLDIDNRLKNR